jgi:hypothetical protein
LYKALKEAIKEFNESSSSASKSGGGSSSDEKKRKTSYFEGASNVSRPENAKYIVCLTNEVGVDQSNRVKKEDVQ